LWDTYDETKQKLKIKVYSKNKVGHKTCISAQKHGAENLSMEPFVPAKKSFDF